MPHQVSDGTPISSARQSVNLSMHKDEVSNAKRPLAIVEGTMVPRFLRDGESSPHNPNPQSQMTLLYRTLEYSSPLGRTIGPLLAASTVQGVAFLKFGGVSTTTEELHRFAKKHGLNASPAKAGSESPAARHLDSLDAALASYFDPSAAPATDLSTLVTLDLRGSEKDKAVWRGLCTIPPGEAWTYGELAAKLGMCGRTSARAVGQANNRNPIPLVVPCHRVVAASHMGGYAGPPATSNRLNLQRKEALLKIEFSRAGKKDMPHTVLSLEKALKGEGKGKKGKTVKVESKEEVLAG